MTYRLILRAQFEGKEQLDAAIAQLQQIQIQGANVSVGLVQGGRQSAASMQTLARSALSVGFMFNMLESSYMRLQMAQMLATNAQDRYNDVVARYGANSEQARRAAKEMESQMSYLNLANQRANVSMGLLIVQMALQTGILEKQKLATIQASAAKMWHSITTALSTTATTASSAATTADIAVTNAHTASVWANVAALKARAVAFAMAHPWATAAVIAAGAVAAGAVGYYMGTRHEGGSIPETGYYKLLAGEHVLSKETVRELKETKSLMTGGTIKKEGEYHLEAGETVIPTGGTTLPTSFSFETHIHLETDLDAALKEQNRRIKNEYKRMIG